MKKYIALAAFTATVLSAMADNAVFIKDDAVETFWFSAANWTDENRSALGEYPNDFKYEVMIPDPQAAYCQQHIITGSDRGSQHCGSLVMNSLAGSQRITVEHSHEWTEGTSNRHDSPATFEVRDLDLFSGWFFSGDALRCFRFPTDGTSVSALSMNARAIVSLPTADSTVTVRKLYNRGALEKNGTGALKLEGGAGATSRIYLKEGALKLDGRAESDTLDALLAGAVLHLDASDSSTFEGYTDPESHLQCVTNWLDVRKNGVKAWVPSAAEVQTSANAIREANPPFIASETSPSSLAYLDFGSAVQRSDGPEAALYGPTNCMMYFSRLENAREIFYVAKFHTRPVWSCVLGDVSKPTLQPASRFLGGSANYGAREGAIFANGKRVSYTYWPDNGYGFTNQVIMSVGSTSNMVLSTIASEQNFATRVSVGGMMVGEILIFTNELSQAERQRINEHLLGKWAAKRENPDLDFGEVFLANDTEIEVPAGRVVKVADLVSESGTIVKKGEGVLEIGQIHPSNATIDVKGGSVRVKNTVGAVSSAAPAADPFVWLDADEPGSLVTTTVNEVDYISAWKDRRGGENAIAATPVLAAPRMPTMSAKTSPTGKKAVSFGDSAETRTFLNFPWWGTLTPNVCAGFIVVRQLNVNETYVPYFGSKNMTFMREGSEGGVHGRFVSENYANPALASAIWTLNGVPKDPIVHQTALKDTTIYNVIAFNADEKVLVDGLAWCRNNQAYSGCMEIGEVLLYDRELSISERRDTEAYLMNKWNGAAHPLAAGSSPSYEFADDVPVVIYADTDSALGSVIGGNGKLVKRGSGKLTVSPEQLSAAGIFEVVTEEGGIEMTVAEPDDGAYFHFDASDVASMTFEVNGSVTNVSKIADVDGRDICATNITMQYANGTPTLDGYVFQDGVRRSGLNFGVNYVSTSSHGMFMTNYRQYLNQFREGITVYRNMKASDCRCSIFSSLGYIYGDVSPYSGTMYTRGFDGSLANKDHNEVYTDWYVYDYDLDRVVSTNGSCCLLDELPHLVGSKPASPVRVDALCFQQVFGGGQTIYEQIGFTKQLSDARRDWWYQHLAYKWFGVGYDPVWVSCYLNELKVNEGETFTFSGNNAGANVYAVAGAGTIVVSGAISDVLTVKASAADVFAGKHLTVDGKVNFQEEVEVVLENDFTGSVRPGSYTILEAEEIVGLDLSKWTISHCLPLGGKKLTLERIGDAIVLKVAGSGSVLVFQ